MGHGVRRLGQCQARHAGRTGDPLARARIRDSGIINDSLYENAGSGVIGLEFR